MSAQRELVFFTLGRFCGPLENGDVSKVRALPKKDTFADTDFPQKLQLTCTCVVTLYS